MAITTQQRKANISISSMNTPNNAMEHHHVSSCSLQSCQSSHQQEDDDSFDMTPPHSPLHCEPDLILASLPPSPREFLPPSPASNSSSKVLTHTKFSLGDYATTTSAPALRILAALTSLVGIPFLIYNCLPAPTVTGNLHIIKNVWDSQLRISVAPVALIALVVAVYFGPCCLSQCGCACGHDGDNADGCLEGSDDRWSRRLARWTGVKSFTIRALFRRTRAFFLTPDGLGLMVAMAFFVPLSIADSAPMLAPGWAWYPMAWFDYKVYQSADLAPALNGLCLDQNIRDIRLPSKSWAPILGHGKTGTEDRRHLPLCLTEDNWQTLSAGGLTSTKAHDVRSVLKGIQYAQGPKAGLAIAVLARDVADHIQNLRENVESLVPFFPRLSVVVFENDSTDGSRELIRKWAEYTQSADKGYHVDLMECAEAVDCKLGKVHRDTNQRGGYGKSKAVGDMDTYRQRVTDYITESPHYADYSHMMVLDIDLAVSLSPFGVLHSLGEHPENAVASSGRQLLPGYWGSGSAPYDFSAFRPWATETNHWILSIHERWCNMMPPGDRWRNSCDAVSPFLYAEAFRMDRASSDNEEFYRVESAFNGAVLYPLDLIRESEATYDAGEDGQRCEHIGFNLALNKPMYVNRRWEMHLDPRNPGGPTGWRAQNAIAHISGTPRLVGMMVLLQFVAYVIFLHSVTTLGVYLVYPLMSPLLVGSQSIRRILFSHHLKRRRIRNGKKDAEETLFKIV